MTLYLDASALVALHIDVGERRVVRDAMAADRDWCTSALTLVEALALVDRVTEEPVLREDLTHDHPDHRGLRSADRDANPDLARAPRDRVRHHALQPDRCQ